MYNSSGVRLREPETFCLSSFFRRRSLAAFFLGLSIYVIYDGTNIAIFKDYDSYIAYVDMIWGATLYALTTSLFNLEKIF